MKMKLGQRVKWISGIGKVRTGTFITAMKVRDGFVLIKGDDGKAHVMREGKPVDIKATWTRENRDRIVEEAA